MYLIIIISLSILSIIQCHVSILVYRFSYTCVVVALRLVKDSCPDKVVPDVDVWESPNLLLTRTRIDIEDGRIRSPCFVLYEVVAHSRCQ